MYSVQLFKTNSSLGFKTSSLESIVCIKTVRAFWMYNILVLHFFPHQIIDEEAFESEVQFMTRLLLLYSPKADKCADSILTQIREKMKGSS